jgi:large subunit ribosomal protein L22
MVTAKLHNHRIAPRKVRLVANAIRGKKVETALSLLDFITKKSALPLKKLIQSAVANAKNLSLETSGLVVKELRVDGGVVMMRRMPRARGSAYPIRKRTSNITLVLEEGVTKPEDKKVIKKAKAAKVAAK